MSKELSVEAIEVEDDEQEQISEYDIVSSPNDFNTLTINSFIDQGAIQTPGFQRNYVWDVKRASKLIESLILGLPVPQVFLYEENRNKFLVIDGQQRLLTVHFFMKGRFPRKEKRSELRKVLNSGEGLTPDLLADDEFFTPFKLQLPKLPNGTPNRFSRLTYETLGDYQNQFNLRTIRNVIVKQVNPKDGDSSIFEMFNRLNTGGVNLNTQEIRASLYHSKFFENLFSLNENKEWRSILGTTDPDFRMRDIEIILRALSLNEGTDSYSGSMTSFINSFCKEAQGFPEEQVAQVTEGWEWFLGTIHDWDEWTFWPGRKKFSALLFESVYCAAQRLRAEGYDLKLLDHTKVSAFGRSEGFSVFSQEGSTKTANVKGRLTATYNFMRGALEEVSQ
ncbi:DUF262 domain-containing protein [Streptomyces sp. KC 17012]|uniref:GmrSD restriction endonuclease domain-containing protein n=1 Tax=Streptomyces plumbidurans TaxID=2814589 RepID=UPI001C9DEF23|nr:DUF262 domain-containing protein [Streptomyces plumbidurans]MBY8344832.1 DUF262 domain-containing protein [Streptomyces plumbidurans]